MCIEDEGKVYKQSGDSIRRVVQSLKEQVESRGLSRIGQPRPFTARIDPMTYFRLAKLAEDLDVTRSALGNDLLSEAVKIAWEEVYGSLEYDQADLERIIFAGVDDVTDAGA